MLAGEFKIWCWRTALIGDFEHIQTAAPLIDDYYSNFFPNPNKSREHNIDIGVACIGTILPKKSAIAQCVLIGAELEVTLSPGKLSSIKVSPSTLRA